MMTSRALAEIAILPNDAATVAVIISFLIIIIFLAWMG